MKILISALLVCLTMVISRAAETSVDSPLIKWGHSRHGSAYDEGPRQKPWPMEGIGKTHFPITTSVPEVQAWFDQGNTLLHGFWFYEAERLFRWCVKLDPECAMAYWALARCAENKPVRAKAFLKEASKRKDRVTQRERDYIEAWEAQLYEDDRDGLFRDSKETFSKLLNDLPMHYPEDIEAKSLYWLYGIRTGYRNQSGPTFRLSYGFDTVLEQVLKVDPDHVGALHYRIHNWDDMDAKLAVDSCLRLSKAAPQCGHLQHMPGHVLSGAGLWNEAAMAMDSATRVEKEYMHRRIIFPENNWNYFHNLDYLCYIQEQLGMRDAAITGAKQLLLSTVSSDDAGTRRLQRTTLLRTYLKYEQWDQLLQPAQFDWDEKNDEDKKIRAYIEARAQIGKRELEKAVSAITNYIGLLKPKSAPQTEPARAAEPPDETWKTRNPKILELKGLVQLERGRALEATKLLTEAAELQAQNWQNDPPNDAHYFYNTLGEACLSLDNPRLAIEAFQKTLEAVSNDGFALSGLVRAYAKVGDESKAREALATLKYVWADADPGNRWLEAALATGIQAEPADNGQIKQRNYKREVLDKLGPSLWTPAAAPLVSAVNSKGDTVTLNTFTNKNVVLVFYLGGECIHCMEQIKKLTERYDDFSLNDTVIVAISKDSVEKIAEFERGGTGKLTFLSDAEFQNARRFQSYDDFEEIELHSTFLIDRHQRVHWSRIGGEPFTNVDFLVQESKRINSGIVHQISTTASASGN